MNLKQSIFLIFFLFIVSFGCQQEESSKKHKEESEWKPDSIVLKKKEGNNFVFPKVPDELTFAGEKIPLTDADVRERFDRELVVNNFYHSNTIFYFKRANRWFPLIKKILAEENVPQDLIYLSVIESGLTQARSPSNALGFWQFLKGTAIDYGLTVNYQIDERMHVAKSTRAACKYLKSAYEKFGSWILAAAAYNRGKAGINNALEAQQVDNFFDLMLNEETSRYVFRIMAVKLIMESPAHYGFRFHQDDLYAPYETKTVTLEEGVYDLVKWSSDHGINYKILKKINPWILGKTLTVRKNNELKIDLPSSAEQLAPFNSY